MIVNKASRQVYFTNLKLISPSFTILSKCCYYSSGSKKEARTLLSSRELEVLQLVLTDKKSQEISELLDISIETVRKHRKNMIARIGAKDMTALIQILRLSNIL